MPWRNRLWGEDYRAAAAAAPPLFFLRRRNNSESSVMMTPRYVLGILAFLICIDMIQILGVLCYQLFLGTYFPWHLYPLMLNRAIELLALLCAEGHVPSVYSIGQVFLTILSMVICIQKEPCGRFNCVVALVLYGLLLAYEMFVAAMVIKISSFPVIGVGSSNSNANRNWTQDHEGQRMIQSRNDENDPMFKDYDDVIVAVQQPNGEKYAIARLCKEIPTLQGFHYAETSSQIIQKEASPQITGANASGIDESYENKHILASGSLRECCTKADLHFAEVDFTTTSTSTNILPLPIVQEEELEAIKLLKDLTNEIVCHVIEGAASDGRTTIRAGEKS